MFEMPEALDPGSTADSLFPGGGQLITRREVFRAL